MSTKWNGSIQGLVISEAAHPELYAELSKTTHRDRTNRLRSLALVGLFALHNRVQATIDVPANSPAGQGGAVEPAPDPNNHAKSKLKERMMGSLS